MYKNEIKSLVNTSVSWVIACNIMGTLFQEGIKILCQKEQSNKEYSPWYRFNEVDYPKAQAEMFRWNLLKLYFMQGEMKNS